MPLATRYDVCTRRNACATLRRMAVQQQHQLVSYSDAMRLAGIRQRVFYERLKARGVATFADPADRRRRWILRSDVATLASPTKRQESSAA